MVCRAVLFDLDGTLLDTLQDIADSTNQALARLALPQHELKEYQYFVGDGREALALRSLPEDQRSEAMMNKLIQAIDEEYSKGLANKTRPYDGIPELLDALTQLGVRMAILSNKPQLPAEQAVSQLLPGWRFEIIAGAVSSVPRKPDPMGALQIANQMRMKPAAFLYLGDTDIDMKTATAAGMYPIGALWGFRTKDELLAGGARSLVARPIDLLDFLGLR